MNVFHYPFTQKQFLLGLKWRCKPIYLSNHRVQQKQTKDVTFRGRQEFLMARETNFFFPRLIRKLFANSKRRQDDCGSIFTLIVCTRYCTCVCVCVSLHTPSHPSTQLFKAHHKISNDSRHKDGKTKMFSIVHQTATSFKVS